MSDFLEEINEQLRPIIEELQQLRAWRKRQEELRLSREKEKERLDSLQTMLNKKYRKVRWIQRVSKIRLLPIFLVSDKDRFEHEYQHYTLAKDMRDESATRLTQIKQELEIVKQDIRHLGELEGMYEELMQMKTSYLECSDLPARNILLQLNQHKEQLEGKLQFIESVMEDGRRIATYLEGVSQHLQNAVDMAGMGDKGFFAIASSRYQDRRFMIRLRSIQHKISLWDQKLMRFDQALKERLGLGDQNFSDFYQNLSSGIRKNSPSHRGLEYTLEYPRSMKLRIERVLRELVQNRDLILQQLQATENKRIQVIETS